MPTSIYEGADWAIPYHSSKRRETPPKKKKSSKEKTVTVEQQQSMADKVLKYVRDNIDAEAVVAGGAPRDWHTDQLASDIDIFVRCYAGKPYQVVEDIEKFIQDAFGSTESTEKTSFDPSRTGGGILAGHFHVPPGTFEVEEEESRHPKLDIVGVTGISVQDVNFDIVLYKPSGNLLPIKEVLNTFDCGICKAVYSGGYVTLHEDAIKDFKDNTITVYTHSLSKQEVEKIMNKHIPKIQKKYPTYKVRGSTKAGGRMV